MKDVVEKGVFERGGEGVGKVFGGGRVEWKGVG